jgi:hypothetical protein
MRRGGPGRPYGSAGYADAFCFTLYGDVTPAFTFVLIFLSFVGPKIQIGLSRTR